MSELPDALRELDRELGEIRFSPRASLEAEILGRWRRGDLGSATPPASPRWLARAAAIALVGLGLPVAWLLLAGPLSTFSTDHCCLDFDGGGHADDGLVVVARRGTEVRRLAIYEDRDGSRSYTPGDPLRFSRKGAPVITESLAPGLVTTEFCCLDYDGGGQDDDALVVVGRPPDRIAMAAIVERGGPPGVPPKLR